MSDTKKKLVEVIQTLLSQTKSLAPPISLGEIESMVFISTFNEPKAITHDNLAFFNSCPKDVQYFWSICAGARIFYDRIYGQWGLEVLDCMSARAETDSFRHERSDDYLFGDVVIGRFIGDSDLLLTRCDPSSDDFGTIIVSTPIDRRSDWETISSSFADFLEQYTKHGGAKFWEN